MFDGGGTSTELVESFTKHDGTTATRTLKEHQLLDRRLIAYAKERAALDVAESFDLVRAAHLKIYKTLGFATFTEYMERRLGYAPHVARERLRVARALCSLPTIAQAAARGELTYSHVRELSRVATSDTEDVWLAAIAGKTAGEVARTVAGHAYGDLPDDPILPELRPVHVRLELTTAVFALWRDVRRAISEERNGEVTDSELVEALARFYLSPETGAKRPAHQISYTQCRDCRRSVVNGAGRAIDVAPDVIEKAHCDARILGDLDAKHPERATRTVTPRMREQVFARDEHRCCVPGCRSSRNLDVHHLIPQAEGGPHALWNLRVVCSGHHTALHDGRLKVRVDRDKLVFHWPFGEPYAPGLDEAGRRTAHAARLEAIFGPPDREGESYEDLLRGPRERKNVPRGT